MNYITLLYNLNEEIVKFNYFDFFVDDDTVDVEEGAFFDMDYCCEKIVSNGEDKHIPEIGLFKIVAEMINFALNDLSSTIKNKEKESLQKIHEVYTAFNEYNYDPQTDISLNSLYINELNVLQSQIDDVKFFELYESFYDKYCHRDLPHEVNQGFNTLQAIFHIDIFDGRFGYELDESQKQPFLEFNLFKSMIKIISAHAHRSKKRNEFDDMKVYRNLIKDCNKILANNL
jgi:hypothetical protein